MLATLKKSWAPRICSWVPSSLWHRLLDIELLLPYYHLVGDREVPHFAGPYRFRSVQQFEADLDFFLQSYIPVSLQDIVDHLDGLRPLPRRCFFPTFDDGFREMYEAVAPILLARGVPAAFFLNTAVIDNRDLSYSAKKSLLIHALGRMKDPMAKQAALQFLADAGVKGTDLALCIRQVTYRRRDLLNELGPRLGCDFATYLASVQPYLTSTQIQNLIGKEFAIGAHSIDHPPYGELNLEEQIAQTQGSVNWLSDRFNYECQAFAFPYRDTGVAPGFFDRIFAGGHLKISFGTAGLCRHYHPKNLERFIMENTNRAAAQILAREFGVNVYRKIQRVGQSGGRSTSGHCATGFPHDVSADLQ